jgi:hypothetical protein
VQPRSPDPIAAAKNLQKIPTRVRGLSSALKKANEEAKLFPDWREYQLLSQSIAGVFGDGLIDRSGDVGHHPRPKHFAFPPDLHPSESEIVDAVFQSEKPFRGEPVESWKLRYFNSFEFFDHTGAAATVDATTIKSFLVLWLVATLVNMWVGVSKAGYSIKDEAPIALLVFAVPAIVAIVIWWRFSAS